MDLPQLALWFFKYNMLFPFGYFSPYGSIPTNSILYYYYYYYWNSNNSFRYKSASWSTLYNNKAKGSQILLFSYHFSQLLSCLSWLKENSKCFFHPFLFHLFSIVFVQREGKVNSVFRIVEKSMRIMIIWFVQEMACSSHCYLRIIIICVQPCKYKYKTKISFIYIFSVTQN